RLRSPERRRALVAAGFGLLEGGARGKALVAQRLLTVIVETGPLQDRFGGDDVGLRLLDRTFKRGDLPPYAFDGGFLRGDLGARGVRRDPIVAVIDLENDIAGMDQRVVARKDRGDMTGHPRAQHRVI